MIIKTYYNATLNQRFVLLTSEKSGKVYTIEQSRFFELCKALHLKVSKD